ncbi:MAG: sigma-54 dependent transcriptional regulator [Alphaproteobacteria bacterium]|nr:sigma-54 dependent transcriptional regulator [Alphaproteobacteria bacterium]
MTASITPKPYILVIDDQTEILEIVSHILNDEGYEVCCISDSRKIVEKVRVRQPDIVLLDVWLNDSRFDGVAVFDIIKQYYPDLPVIMISGHSSIETAVSALKRGVFDFLAKPFSTEQLVNVVQRAMDVRRLKRDYSLLQESSRESFSLEKISPVWEGIYKNLQRVSEGRSRIFLSGEIGVGKNYAARYIHAQSPFQSGPFIVFDADIEGETQEEILEALLGREEITQADRAEVRIGAIERAARGTLHLKNIHLLNKEVQRTLLVILETNTFMRRGGKEEIPLEARFISSSHVDIKKEVERDAFSSDLYYRLNVVEIKIPPLKTFGNGIVAMVSFFICWHVRKNITVEFDRSAKFSLESYAWPGNLREASNVAEWLSLTVPLQSSCMLINNDILALRLGSSNHTEVVAAPGLETFDITHALALPMRQAREYFEQYYLEFHLKRHNRNFSRTAEVVGMERTALHRKMRQLHNSN